MEKKTKKNIKIRETNKSGKRIGDLYFPRGLKRIITSDTRHNFKSYDDILAKMRSIDVGPYKAEELDCDDRTKWVLANTICDPNYAKLHGAPVGEARGRYSEDSAYHSLIIFWVAPNKRYYYEPASKKIVNFHPREIII